MEYLLEKSYQKINLIPDTFHRYLMQKIQWEARLIGIKGARGVGKTTLLLQYLKNHAIIEKSLYVSLDNIWFGENTLIALADTFSKRGGIYFFVDEVHKYPNWSREIKNIYDDYPNLKVVFSGSSMLEILNARADLSRRAISYSLKGLSFREYLNISLGLNLQAVSLDDILNGHIHLSAELLKMFKPLEYFDTYLKIGHYPFFMEGESLYLLRLEEVVKMIIEIELPVLRGVEIAYLPKIRQLLQIIAQSVPFVPNLSKLSERIGINRTTLLTYFNYLNEAGIIKNIYKDASGITRLQKPDKVFLENTNLMYTFKESLPEKGNVRETFFVNQLSEGHQINYTDIGDFLIDGAITFEIGGKNKNKKQIANIPDSYIVVDDMEYGFQNSIPLWLFGFLY